MYQTLKIDDFYLTISQMGLYILTILIVLFIHAWIFMPITFLLVTRKNPYKYMLNLMDVLPTAITCYFVKSCSTSHHLQMS